MLLLPLKNKAFISGWNKTNLKYRHKRWKLLLNLSIPTKIFNFFFSLWYISRCFAPNRPWSLFCSLTAFTDRKFLVDFPSWNSTLVMFYTITVCVTSLKNTRMLLKCVYVCVWGEGSIYFQFYTCLMSLEILFQRIQADFISELLWQHPFNKINLTSPKVQVLWVKTLQCASCNTSRKYTFKRYIYTILLTISQHFDSRRKVSSLSAWGNEWFGPRKILRNYHVQQVCNSPLVPKAYWGFTLLHLALTSRKIWQWCFFYAC